MLRKLFIALGFFTRIPVKMKSEVSEDEFYNSMILLPAVGLIVGSVLLGISYLFKDVDNQIRSFILLLSYLWITGGLHIDGFIDTMDGILSGREREKVLEIMKDSRIGAFGAISLTMLLLGYFVTWQFTDGITLLLAATASRSCAIMAASLSSYAKETNDLGKRFVDGMGTREMAFALAFSLAVVALVNYLYIISLLVCIISTFALVKVFKNKINGMTGDTIGMTVEINQLIFTCSSYLILLYLG